MENQDILPMEITILTKKKCRSCGEEKPLTTFYRGHRRCKQCESKAHELRKKTRRENDPEFAKRERDQCAKRMRKKRATDPEYRKKRNEIDRIARIKQKYGLTPEIEETLLKKQKHRCATCGTKFSEVTLCRDHDHTLGHFRGFLCMRCNTALGFIEATGDPEGTLRRLLEIVKTNALFMRPPKKNTVRKPLDKNQDILYTGSNQDNFKNESREGFERNR